MKIAVQDIDESVQELEYEEATPDLEESLRHGNVSDYEFPHPVQVSLQYHRSGDDLVFFGRMYARPMGHCARCLESFEFDLESEIAFVLVPSSQAKGEDIEAAEKDLDLNFYEGDEVDLTPLVREQIILALPTVPLCKEECRGLCPSCGANRNVEECGCGVDTGDPRLSVFRTLKVSG